MKYVVLGPIGLIEFVFRFLFVLGWILLAFGWIGLMDGDYAVEEVTDVLIPFCWELLDERPVSLKKG